MYLGSANETKTAVKTRKKSTLLRLNKKEMIETALKSFLPEGVSLSKMQPLTNEQY